SLLVFALALARLDAGGAPELAVDAPDALDLSLRREALVEPLAAEALLQVRPRRQLARPAPDAPLDRIVVDLREVRAHAQHRLDRHRARHHVLLVAPRAAPHLLGRLEEV